MNRLIVKYAYPITAVILVIFAWVVYTRLVRGSGEITTLAIAAVVVWAIGTPTFVLLWPRITVGGFKRAILKRGFGGGPIPVNSLYAEPNVSSASPTGSLMGTGTDDVLYIAGWLDLKDGPQVLRVPDMASRYYSLQFTDPPSSANFAYVGKRATGTKAGEYLLSGPGWQGTVPAGMTQISAPHASALVIGRVFVDDDSDRPAAYALAKQIQLAPLAQ
ncbi:DUF1254 domain-containing protein [Microbacterium deminutum]|uniref:DUF1254 domain-containing protein n=1 Tax=Microbacterium deminutum TaxID=344164 RepID=A0ABP5BM90_9MICO